MIFKLDTKKIGGKRYCTGSHLVSEKGIPDYILENDTNVLLEWADENYKYQWEVVANDDFDSEIDIGKENRPFVLMQNPIVLTEQELQKKEEKIIEKEILSQVSLVNIIEAIIALKNGDTQALDIIEQKIKNIKEGV